MAQEEDVLVKVVGAFCVVFPVSVGRLKLPMMGVAMPNPPKGGSPR